MRGGRFLWLACCGLTVAVAGWGVAQEGVVRQRYVMYSDFGAKGDGESDDQEAIVKAHAYANKNNLPVKADEGARYYIGGGKRTAIIQTDTDFGTARFIIDDRKLESIHSDVFRVTSRQKSIAIKEIRALRKGEKKLDVTFPSQMLVQVSDANKKHFIRYGLNQNQGVAKQDIILVESDGRIHPSTPVVWDFESVTSATGWPVDEEVLAIRGGEFTTIANQAESNYKYHARGLKITRSNVLVDGICHLVSGEGESGAPYGGFINISLCTGVVVKNTTLTPRKTYRTIGSAGKPVSMGSYDISVSRAVNIMFQNCKQSIDINDRRYWGIMGSNFCKNLIYDNCQFSRFDAHMGVTGATIKNSTLGYMGINAIGHGTFTVENSTVNGGSFINLRGDYGSTWDGEFVIRNCVFVPGGGNRVVGNIIGGHYTGKHDFGYVCHMPRRVVVDGLRIDDKNVPANYNGPMIFSNFNRDKKGEDYVEDFPYVMTEEVVLRNVTTTSGKELQISPNRYMFSGVRVVRQ